MMLLGDKWPEIALMKSLLESYILFYVQYFLISLWTCYSPHFVTESPILY